MGVPSEVVGSTSGAVHVIYGSASGLTSAGDQFWHRSRPGVPGTEAGGQFGASLVAGDFNGDDFDDLAIGVPGDDLGVGGFGGAGSANVLYGSAVGLTTAGAQLWHQDRPGILDVAEERDLFGAELKKGDFNGDGFEDLIIGAPQEDLGAIDVAGAVHVIYGSASGLTAAENQFWTQDSPGILDQAEIRDEFGFNVAGGDFDGDGFADLAIGVPGELGNDRGAVHVLYGSFSGLTAGRDELWHQNQPGVLDSAEGGDAFGSALTTRDFNRDGFIDLAVGVPFERFEGSTKRGGAVQVFYGTVTGLTAAGNQLWSQDSPGILDEAESSDNFGHALTTGDFDGDRFQDLVVGVPGEGFTPFDLSEQFGVVQVIRGSAVGLTSAGNQLWSQDSPGILDQAEVQDRFGSSLHAR